MPVKSRIRTIPHYPKQGIMFRDITTLLKDAVGMRLTIDELVARYRGRKISKVAGIASRGFIIGAPVAYLLGVGFIPIRKKGKLPGRPSASTASSSRAPTASRSTPTPSRRASVFC